LFNNIAEKVNLIEILKNTIPKFYKQLLNIAYYIIAEHKAMMYCEDWMEENGINTKYSYSSQGISKLFDAISPKNRDEFYYKWLKSARENEYLAVDITSISSYSKTTQSSEFGYNRDHDRLKQINICTLFGEKSYLPMYQTEFTGNINDVNTLKTIIYEFYSLINDFSFTLVMDKGFCSLDNIEFMLSKKDIKFIISVPLTNNFASSAIDDFITEPKRYSNFIQNSNNNDRIYGKKINILLQNHKLLYNYETHKNDIDDSTKLFGYIYHNQDNDINEKGNFIKNLKLLKIMLKKIIN
jgi:transposase